MSRSILRVGHELHISAMLQTNLTDLWLLWLRTLLVKRGEKGKAQGLAQLDDSSKLIAGYTAVAMMKIGATEKREERKAQSDPQYCPPHHEDGKG